MWVRLKTIKHIDRAGVKTKHYPGEWVNVGKYLALGWLSAGEADRPDMIGEKIMPGCGIILRGSSKQARELLQSVEIVEGDPHLAFERTLFWDTSANLKLELAVSGFNFLERWEVAVPLASYETLARDLAEVNEIDRATEDLRDLRVLTYDPRVLFLRRCNAARRLLNSWQQERENYSNECLAFLVALYKTKPLVQALPVQWLR